MPPRRTSVQKVHTPPAVRTNAQKLHMGLGIILEREPQAEVSGHGETLYAGSFDGPYTKGEREQLAKLGWHEDEEAWAFTT